MSTGLLASLGHGEIACELALEAEQAVSKFVRRGLEQKTWRLSDGDFETLRRVVVAHDFQLSNAPLIYLAKAFERVAVLAQ